MNKVGEDKKIAIIGAGFGGMAMAIELLNAGIDSFVIYEMGDDVGGTWRDNTYPGCACDIPSHFYSFSFEPNPNWSHTYSPQPEIQAYLVGVAEKYDLYEHIQFNTEILGATYDEQRCRWTLESRDGRSFESQFVVLGVGGLSRPKIPNLTGIDEFSGPLFHSSRWDHDVSLANKKVAVVGTGASAAQIVPAIADEVAQLTVFQRTPPWVFPRRDRAYPPWLKALFEQVPAIHSLYRYLIYLRNESHAVAFLSQPRLMKLFAMASKRHARKVFDDPEMRNAVTPDYSVGCKRVVISDDYYPALAKDHVELVPQAVTAVTSEGLVDARGVHRDVDIIVMATGFYVTDFLSYFEVRGRNNKSLNEAWRDGAEAYYGVAVNDFPNLFMLVGPNTGLGHNSIVYMIECQANLIRQAIAAAVDDQAEAIEVRPSAHRQFNRRLQDRLGETVWNSGCKSWYLDKNGKNTAIWPGYTFEYWLGTRRLERRDFRLSWRGENGTTEG